MKKEFPKKMKRELAAYIAGLMDGDGHISIAKQIYGKKDKSPHYRLTVVFNMTHRETIEWIRDLIPGSMYSVKTKHDNRGSWNRKPIYRWSLWGPRAGWFIKQIVPFMRVRKKQADLAVIYHNSIKSGRGKTNKKFQYVPLSEEELQKRNGFYLQMRDLNSRKAQGE